MNKQIDLIDLSGTHYEMGYIHGSILKKKIEAFIKNFRLYIKQGISQELNPEVMRKLILNFKKSIKNKLPELYDEILGIADGADVSINEIVMLNSFLDISDFVNKSLRERTINEIKQNNKQNSKSVPGCTSFIIPKGTKYKTPFYLGQTFDHWDFLRDIITVLKIRKSHGKFLLYTFAGVIGCIGLNSYKLGICMNKLTSNEFNINGFPYPFIFRELIKQSTIKEVLLKLNVTPRITGSNFMLLKGDSAFSVETITDNYEIISKTHNNYVFHTNHYQSSKFLSFEQNFDEGSRSRLKRVSNLVKETKKRNTKIFKNILADHNDNTHPICKHQTFSINFWDSHIRTINGIILIPSKEMFFISKDYPCHKRYIKFKM